MTLPRRELCIIAAALLAAGGFFVLPRYLPAVWVPFGPAPRDITRALPDGAEPPAAVNESLARCMKAVRKTWPDIKLPKS